VSAAPRPCAAPVRGGGARRWALVGRIHAGGDGRHPNTPDVFVWCLRCTCSSRSRRRTTGGGRRDGAAPSGREARYGNPTPPTSAVRRLSPGVTAPPACRPRDGVPVKWPRAEVPGAPLRAAHPIRTPAVAATERGRRNGRAASRRLQGRVSGAPYAPAPLLGRLASGGCWRADPAVRSGPHAQDAGGAVTRDRTHGRPMIVAGPREMAEMPKRL
jgi:hypothetical protein